MYKYSPLQNTLIESKVFYDLRKKNDTSLLSWKYGLVAIGRKDNLILRDENGKDLINWPLESFKTSVGIPRGINTTFISESKDYTLEFGIYALPVLSFIKTKKMREIFVQKNNWQKESNSIMTSLLLNVGWVLIAIIFLCMLYTVFAKYYL